MKHKHYDMIVAKAANMELFVFERPHTATHDKELFKELAPDGNKAIWFHESCDYFLCLPQHKEACLHWLNGGKAEAIHEDFGLMELADSEAIEWGVKSVFMKDSIEIRIKPKKDEFSELLEGLTAEKPISDLEKEGLIYKLIESFYGSGILIKFDDIKSECK